MTSERRNNSNMNWDRYGLDSDNIPRNARARNAAGGFVDLGNESEYATAGHQPSGADEVFASEQGDKPWWRTHFFISQPTLFGKWDGVFTSCMVNIFGVIVFLRSGWIVGQAGIIHSVMVVICSVGIALISVLSAIGIVERIRVETGGVYFLIANTLGSRFGGSLGLLYCFGQAVGCALNVLGFGESMAGLVGFPHNVWMIRAFATSAVLLLGVINVAGVKWVVKLQFALLLVLLLSALDFMVGSFITEPDYNDPEGFLGWGTGLFFDNLYSDYSKGTTWFTVFGVFFPTITGVLAGINMSGDLRTPSTDIPNGTLAALSTSTFLYLVFMIFLGSTVHRTRLLTDFMIASYVSAIHFLLLAGIYVSSMSSCLGAMYGTPRVLQSIANEAVIPGIGKLGQGRGPNKVPLNSMGIVAVVIIAFIMVGDINKLAPIVTMPFLLTYACIDYSYFALAQTFDIQTKREERFRIQAQSPLYESRNYGATNQHDNHDNDLDVLFPDRTRHKDLSSPDNTPYHQQRLPQQNQPQRAQQETQQQYSDSAQNSTSEEPSVNSTNHVDIDGNTEEDNEPIAPIRPPIHQKTKNWYSGFCNRWASLMGAVIKVFIMFLVNVYMALICVLAVFIVWFYVGTANPAIRPGIADEFRLFVWLKNGIFQCFGKKVHDYEQVIVTPHVNVNLMQTQLNEDNEDFSSRRRYHQTGTVTGQLIDI